jgi:hypothetical protein
MPIYEFSSNLPCVMDIEASGFGRSSYPIEVGYVLPDSRAECMLIKPAVDWQHWDEAAAGTHRIARSLLLEHGRTPHEAAMRINHDLAGLTVYCDGWAHDFVWLAVLFDEAGLSPSFRLESVNCLLTESQLAQLDEARRSVMREMGLNRHRASNDARVLQAALQRVRAAQPPEIRSEPVHAPAAGAT